MTFPLIVIQWRNHGVFRDNDKHVAPQHQLNPQYINAGAVSGSTFGSPDCSTFRFCCHTSVPQLLNHTGSLPVSNPLCSLTSFPLLTTPTSVRPVLIYHREETSTTSDRTLKCIAISRSKASVSQNGHSNNKWGV